MTTATATKTKSRPKKSRKGRSRKDIEAELARLDEEDIRDLEILKQYKDTHLWEFLKPYMWQGLVSEELRKYLIVMAPAPNGIGKSVIAMCILSSWVEGYEAWSPVDADYPGAVKHEGKYYKPSSLGIKPPVDIRVTGEDWDHHLGKVVVKVMKEWFSVDNFHMKKNTSGTEYFWTHKKNGSTIELMTHGMDIKLFEGWRGHGWIPDEPPKYEIFKAMARGLAEKKGKILIPTTPLREAWMLDKLVLSSRSDVSVIKDLTLYDNEDSYDNDNRILDELGLDGKRTRYWREADGQKKTFFDLILRKELYIGDDGAKSGPPDDQGASAERFLRENLSEGCEDVDEKINDLIFLRKAKDTDLEDKPSRFFGLFKKLVGLVVKEFNKAKHIMSANIKNGSILPEIPTNWPVSFQIDFHLSKPHAIVFYAWDERSIQYVVDEVWENMSAEEVAYLIIRRKKANCWNISYGEIDPLSKGDHQYIKNRDADAVSSFSIIEELLADEGIELGVASKDKKSGFGNIKSALKGANGIPSLYFLDCLQSVKDDKYGVVHEIQRLCYDDNGEIEKVNDHFMECLYRSTLMGIEYREPRPRVPVSAGGGSSEGWLGA